jgi:ABC-type multidrug transport system ATPase subunit
MLILDEPFNHLDQKSCEQVSEAIKKLADSGVAVLYTGHEYKIEGSHPLEVTQWR